MTITLDPWLTMIVIGIGCAPRRNREALIRALAAVAFRLRLS